MDHEVMWWSDHGSQRRKKVFRINKWLKEKGFLDYKVDEEFAKKLKNRDVVDSPFSDQMGFNHPAVEINWDNTVAFCSDAFDSMIDVTENATKKDIEEIKNRLKTHPAIKNVWKKSEYFKGDESKYWFMPKLIVERGDNVLVTSNIDPDVKTFIRNAPKNWEEFPEDNMGMRPGVHSRYGCFGGDVPKDSEVDDGKPYQLYDIIWRFIDPESIEG